MKNRTISIIAIVLLFCLTSLSSAQPLAAGDYTVGSGGTYATLPAAITDLNTRGVAGHVRFLLIDASYTITSALIIDVPTNPPAVDRTITIKPGPGVSPTITGSLTNASILRILGTSYVTIDGSQTDGGSTRDLTLTNTNTTGPSVISVASINPATISNITIKNCNIINGTSTTGNAAMVVSSNASDPTSTGGYFTNVTLHNNSIRRAGTGIYCNGGTTSQQSSNLTITSNSLTPVSGADSIGAVGIFLLGINGVSIANNTVGGFSQNRDESDVGIWLASLVSNGMVERNKVYDLVYRRTGGYGAKGIMVTTAMENSNNTVVNNMIYNITGDGDSYTSYGSLYCPSGIHVGPPPGDTDPQSGVNVYYNTIYLFGNTLNYNAQVYSFGITVDVGSTANIKNNIIVNNLGRKASTGVGAVAIAAQSAATQFATLDYNSYYCEATNGSNLIGKIGATNYATLADFKAATGKDANSVSKNVTFQSTVTPVDVHLGGSSITDPDLIGDPIAGITTDFDGDSRSVTSPFMGADEPSDVVPITLGSFTAQMNPEGHGVRLEWMTVSEISNYGFYVQRRLGNGAFADLENSFVPGRGTTITPQHYSYVDASIAEAGSYDYRLRQVDLDGTVHYTDHVSVQVTLTSVRGEVPAEFFLSTNYPNPFNPMTTIEYGVPVASLVELSVYNLLGERIVMLVGEEQAAGMYRIAWNGYNANKQAVASGLYFYHLRAGTFSSVRKMLLTR